jgi:ABC-type polysaccharide/polyol phosphate export permease
VRLFLDHFGELYRHRALLAALVWRDLKARYRGSVLGYLWTLLNPLVLLAVYRLVFTRYTSAVDMPHYAVFLFVGILPWLWIATAVASGANAIVAGASLITRACMPPQVLPAVAVIATGINFLLALPMAVAAVWLEGLPLTAALAVVPLAILVQVAFLYGVVLTLSALTVRFRDVAFLTQSLLTVWFLVTPVAYPLAGVPSAYRPLLLANPATALVVPLQEALVFGRVPDPALPLLGAAWALAALAVGVAVFESSRDTFAEEI